MKLEEKKIKSNFDNLDISIYQINPVNEPIGIVHFVHGMSEHGKRYKAIMEFFASKGYICLTSDNRGHGNSVINKNDLGYFYDTTATGIVEDLHQIVKDFKDKYPNLKYTLIGHSMGSLIVRNFTALYDNLIDNLIVVGSPSYNSGVKFGLIVTKILKLFKGEYYRSNLINNIAFGSYNKKFGSKNAWVNSQENRIKEYNEDELCGFIFTLNGFENLFKLMIRTYNKKHYKVKNKNLKILFLSGKDDPVIINENKFFNSIELFKKLNYKEVEYKLYEGSRHEIINDKDYKEVYKDILKFIKKP